VKVTDILKEKKGKAISVEIEPPLRGKSINDVWETLDPLVELGINYINITYHPKDIIKNEKGVLVYQRKRPGTRRITRGIIRRYGTKGIEPVPHIICTEFTKYGAQKALIKFNNDLGIENVMALMGDTPKLNGKFTEFKPKKRWHSHAGGLIKEISNLKLGVYLDKWGRYLEGVEGEPIDFCIGAACYPEGYYESQTLDENIKYTKAKIDAGADYLVTQLFFDNNAYLRFVEEAIKAKINVPIIPGIFPISLYGHLKKLPEVFGCLIPKELRDSIGKYKDNKDGIRKAGIEWCVNQCLDLLKNGAPSLHFFANRGAPVEEVIKEIYKSTWFLYN